MGVTNVDPNTLAQTWAQNLAGATTRIQAGVNAVTTPPGQAAAAQAAVWLANVTAAQNLWAQKVAAVPLQSWKDSMNNKGVPRIATGAQAAQSSFATTLGKILQAEKGIVQSLPTRGNLQQNIARATAFMTQMAATKGTFS